MKPELFWLAATATMTMLMWIPYVLNRTARQSLPKALATPSMSAGPVEVEWAQRAKRAHANTTAGVPGLRTLSFSAGLIGELLIAWQIFAH